MNIIIIITLCLLEFSLQPQLDMVVLFSSPNLLSHVANMEQLVACPMQWGTGHHVRR